MRIYQSTGGEICEECGEQLITTGIPSSVCTSCGFANREGVKFCEQCGELISVQKKASVSARKSRKNPKHKKSKLLKWTVRVAIVLFILLLGLIILGMIPNKNELAPVVSAEPIPLLTLQGLPAADVAMVVEPGAFSATATDPAGIERMELYVDGELIDAENYPGEPNTPVVFEPPLEALPEGEHEIIVVVTNSEAQTAQSQVVPVINDEPVPLPPEEGFVIEPDPYNLPEPEVITAMLSADRKTVKVGWSLPAVPFKETNIYLQPPGAAGMTLQAVAGSTVTEYDFPAHPAGLWYIYVSYVFLDGREGPLGHVHMVVPDPETDEAIISSKSMITSANVSLEMQNESLINGIFAYVRIGGEANRYQRIPVGQGEVLYRQVTGKLFNFQVPFNNYPISQPMLVDVELWALNEDQTPYRVGWYSHTFTTEEMARGQMEFNTNEFKAQIVLEIEEKFGVLVTDTVGGPRPILLPPPTHTQIASFIDQCQFVTSTLGLVRDALYPQCVDAVLGQTQQYLLWGWPSKEPGALQATEDDITGFELKLVVTDAQNQVVGENILPIPFPQARSVWRNTYQDLGWDCGVRSTWYLRAVSTDAVSEWVYAGTQPPEPCEKEFQGFGCGGELKYVLNWVNYDQSEMDKVCAPSNDLFYCYDRELSGKDKVTCDNEYLEDMLSFCNDISEMSDPVTCVGIAYANYDFLNLWGRFFYKGDMNVLDCTHAYNPGNCLLGHSPEALQNAWNGIKSGYNYGEMALKTGWGKVEDAGGWVGDQVSNGWNKGKDFLSGKGNPLW